MGGGRGALIQWNSLKNALEAIFGTATIGRLLTLLVLGVDLLDSQETRIRKKAEKCTTMN
jgi:hypothetical protein